VVRMPDGSRQGRRFLKTDKFQFLFDFLDIGRTFKPGTYRLVILYHCILIKFCMYIEKNVPVSCFRKLRVTFMINQDTRTFDQFLMQASVALNIRL